jgi:hypothetical protein
MFLKSRFLGCSLVLELHFCNKAIKKIMVFEFVIYCHLDLFLSGVFKLATNVFGLAKLRRIYSVALGLQKTNIVD